MNIFMYLDGNSFIHKASVLSKLIGLIFISSLIFIINNIWFSLFCCCSVVLLFIFAKINIKKLLSQFKLLYISLALIFVFQYYFNSLLDAFNISFRLIAIFCLGLLFTFTSKSSDIVETIENLLKPLSKLGVNYKKVSLSISLAIRFIPQILRTIKQVKEAQKVRGLNKNIFAMIIPVIIQTLKSADEIANAIDARMFYNDLNIDTNID